jgi:hypothetical protein
MAASPIPAYSGGTRRCRTKHDTTLRCKSTERLNDRMPHTLQSSAKMFSRSKIVGTELCVNILPHAAEHTNLHAFSEADCANGEADMLERYSLRKLCVMDGIKWAA